MTQKTGFTLIELLIVVSIISLLAAIAVPNFLEAQIRTKVSRVEADIQSLQLALEGYNVDHDRYPPGSAAGAATGMDAWKRLTTPVVYIPSIPWDPFSQSFSASPSPFRYALPQPLPETPGVEYWILSVGPDREMDVETLSNFHEIIVGNLAQAVNYLYDNTNGTKSQGDILASDMGFLNP